jgi:hypothetical protein
MEVVVILVELTTSKVQPASQMVEIRQVKQKALRPQTHHNLILDHQKVDQAKAVHLKAGQVMLAHQKA